MSLVRVIIASVVHVLVGKILRTHKRALVMIIAAAVSPKNARHNQAPTCACVSKALF